MSADHHIPRQEEAKLVASLLNPDPLVGESAGLFLAAPRRTGKSTFLRRDLTPLLERSGRYVIYVDLWADRTSDPSQLIKARLTQALKECDSLIAKLRRNIPFESVGALGFSVKLNSIGNWEGTFADALGLLCDATGKDVVLIVDEAQQSLVSDAGRDAMYALKAARDAVNQADRDQRLYLIMTGSHRDKLAALVHDQQAPFFGARVRDFPRLGESYTAALTERVNARLAEGAQLTEACVAAVFEDLGHRPEILTDCLRDLILETSPGDEALRKIANRKKTQMREALLAEIGNLTRLQQAILHKMAADGINFAPYTEETRQALAGNRQAYSKGGIQKALDVLREKGLIWRPSFGSYVLENADLAQVLQRDDALRQH